MKICKVIIADTHYFTVLVQADEWSEAIEKAEIYVRNFKHQKEQNKSYKDPKIMTSEQFMSEVDGDEYELEDLIIDYEKETKDNCPQVHETESTDEAPLGDRRFKSQRDITPPHEYPYRKQKIKFKPGETIDIITESGRELKLQKFDEHCSKCQREVDTGKPSKGRHNTGCPNMGVSNVAKTSQNAPQVNSEAPERLPEEPKELTGYQADWRSKCCDARLIVKGGEEGTNHYECFKCCNPCDAYNPEIEKAKSFDCDDCGTQFEANTEETIVCPECKKSNVWPSKSN